MKELLLITIVLILHLSYIANSVDCSNNLGAGTCTITGCTSSAAPSTACSCAATATPDIFMSVSVHRSIEQGITWAVEEPFLAAIISAGVAEGGGFGLQQFGTTATVREALTDVSTGDHATLESYLDQIVFTTHGGGIIGDYGNNLKTAMQSMQTQMDGRPSTNQKIHLVVLNYDPKDGSDGTTTQIDSLTDPCPEGVISKRSGIRNYVIAIGVRGVDYHNEFFECIVENIDTDIIEVNPNSPMLSLTEILDKVCVTDYQFKITEIKTSSAAHPTLTPTTPRFVELFNFGKPIPDNTLQLSVDTVSTYNNGAIPQGVYFTFYDSGDGSISGSYNTALDFATVDTQSFSTVTAAIGTNTEQISKSDLLTIADGYSYELRGLTMRNSYGLNWRQSCGIGGSPGVANTASEVQNGVNNYWECDQIDTSCNEGTNVCDLNSANGVCNTGDGGFACVCVDNTVSFGDATTCNTMVSPGQSYCTGTIFKETVEGTTQDALVLVWNKPEYDGNGKYTIDYVDKAGVTQTDFPVGGMNAWATRDFAPFDSGLDYATPKLTFTSINLADYTSVDDTVECLVQTSEPTREPTVDPTQSPTKIPTSEPTQSPTFESPGVFLWGDMCGLKRCDCWGQSKSCCDDEEDCEQIKKTIPVGGSDELNALIHFQAYPENYNFPITVYYEIFEWGTVNKSDFADATTSAPGDTTTTSAPVVSTTSAGTTLRRRIMEKISSRRRRRLLQNGTTTTTSGGTGTTGTAAGTTKVQKENRLEVGLGPLGVGSIELKNVLDLPLTNNITLEITQNDIVCEEDDFNCLTKTECESYAAYYTLVVINCTTDNTEDLSDEADLCSKIYPSYTNILVERGDCGIMFPVDTPEGGIPGWLWWVLLALLIFLLILAWLVYRFWWKQKKAAGELGDAEDELDQQIADNNAGFGADLDTGDVKFNPMATGVPGMNRPADAFGNEIHNRQIQAQNEMVDVQAEVFQVRHDYGQVQQQTKNNY